MRFADGFGLMDQMGNKFKAHFGTSLYKNSVFIGVSRILSAAIGLVFWEVAARYYSASNVGTAIALISSLAIKNSGIMGRIKVVKIKNLEFPLGWGFCHPRHAQGPFNG